MDVTISILLRESLENTFICLSMNLMDFKKQIMRIYLALNLLILEHATVSFMNKKDFIRLCFIADLGINLLSKMIMCKI